MSGSQAGNNFPDIMQLFSEKDGYTTLAGVVAILVSLALIFTTAQLAWTRSVSADVQSVADATALAGSNTVAKYVTCATVLDACVLTLGIVGVSVLGIGLVASAIPPLQSVSGVLIEAGNTILKTRSSFAKSVYEGLQRVERALPYAVALNSSQVVVNQPSQEIAYTGIALPFPYEGTDGSFGNYDDLLKEARQIGDSAQDVQPQAQKAEEAKEKADADLLEGWSYDCGNTPYSLYERAGKLASLYSTANPYYPTVDGWTFEVPLRRAQAYFEARLAQESPVGSSIEAQVDSVARRAFYEYALEQINHGYYRSDPDGTVDLNLEALPKNTAEVRETTLYTDKVWPITQEGDSLVLHYSVACPGAQGPVVGTGSLSDLEGDVHECPICSFSISDIGKVPQASTAIDNGFEYHWKHIVEASKQYQIHKNEQVQAEKEAQKAAEKGNNAFDEALKKLAAPRPRLSPPGRFGCVSFVCDSSEHPTPDALNSAFSQAESLPPRAAIAGSVLVPDEATPSQNILSQFFERLKSESGSLSSSAGWILDSAFDLWGSLLLSYGNGFDSLSNNLNEVFDTLDGSRSNKVASWIREKLTSIVELTGFQPVDLRIRKPVLTNTANIFNAAGVDGAVRVRSYINSLPPPEQMSNPQALAHLVSMGLEDVFGSSSFEIATLAIPGTDIEIPLTLELEGVP